MLIFAGCVLAFLLLCHGIRIFFRGLDNDPGLDLTTGVAVRHWDGYVQEAYSRIALLEELETVRADYKRQHDRVQEFDRRGIRTHSRRLELIWERHQELAYEINYFWETHVPKCYCWHCGPQGKYWDYKPHRVDYNYGMPRLQKTGELPYGWTDYS